MSADRGNGARQSDRPIPQAKPPSANARSFHITRHPSLMVEIEEFIQFRSAYSRGAFDANRFRRGRQHRRRRAAERIHAESGTASVVGWSCSISSSRFSVSLCRNSGSLNSRLCPIIAHSRMSTRLRPAPRCQNVTDSIIECDSYDDRTIFQRHLVNRWTEKPGVLQRDYVRTVKKRNNLNIAMTMSSSAMG